MKKLRTALLLGIACYAAAAMVDHEKPVRIMFNPATDGPLLVERKVSSFVSREFCLTGVPISGSSSIPVLTPCLVSSPSLAFTVTTGEPR